MTIGSTITMRIILNPLVLFLIGFELLSKVWNTFRMGSIRNGALIGSTTPNQTHRKGNNNNFHGNDFTQNYTING